MPGEIIVASFTDVGWTPLFLLASGVVADIGGPLSHAAVVAREYGIPAVVNVKEATKLIQPGDLITVDGDTATDNAVTVRDRDSLEQNLHEAGFTNQAVQMGIGAWGLIGLEGVIEAAPDWLIIEEVGLRHNSVTKDFLTHRALARMVEQGHTNLLYIDARLWSCGTPRSVELVEQLRQVRQP